MALMEAKKPATGDPITALWIHNAWIVRSSASRPARRRFTSASTNPTRPSSRPGSPRQIRTTVNKLGKRAVTKTTVKIMSPYHGSALAGVAMGQGDAQFSRLADRF